MVILGGAFFASGNVNPAAEANVKSEVLLELYLTSDANISFISYYMFAHYG